MSLNDILKPPGSESWKYIYVNNANVADTLTVNNLQVTGNNQ